MIDYEKNLFNICNPIIKSLSKERAELINEKLKNNQITAQDILDDEEITNDLIYNKTSILVKNLSSQIIENFITYSLQEPTSDEYHIGYKYPFLSSEILSAEGSLIRDKIFSFVNKPNEREPNFNLFDSNSPYSQNAIIKEEDTHFLKEVISNSNEEPMIHEKIENNNVSLNLNKSKSEAVIWNNKLDTDIKLIESDKTDISISSNEESEKIDNFDNFQNHDSTFNSKEITNNTHIIEFELIRKNSPFPNIKNFQSSNLENKNNTEEVNKDFTDNSVLFQNKFSSTFGDESFKRSNSDNINKTNKSEIQTDFERDKMVQQNKYLSNLNGNHSSILIKNESNDSIGSHALGKQMSADSIFDENEYFLVEKILRFVETKKPLNHVLCGYFSKIFNSLCKLKISQFLKVIYNNRNIHLIDNFFFHINRKAISDCILKLLTLYSVSIDDSSFKLDLLNRLIDCIEYKEYYKEYQDLVQEYNLPVSYEEGEFDYNKFYFYQEKKEGVENVFEVLIEAIKNKNIYIKFFEHPQMIERLFQSVFGEIITLKDKFGLSCDNDKYLKEIKELKFGMCLRFMTTFMESLAKDFKKDTRIDRRSTYNNKSYGNDYLIRKEEYEKFLEVEKRIFNVTHSFKYCSITKLENVEIEKYVKILNIFKDNYCPILSEFQVLYENVKNNLNQDIFHIDHASKYILIIEYLISSIDFITISMDNPQVYFRDILSVFESIFKYLIEKRLFEMVLYLIVTFKNFNIYHQITMRLLEAITHKFIPDMVHEYLFEKLKLDVFLINHIFYFNNKNLKFNPNQGFNSGKNIENVPEEKNIIRDKHSFNLKMPAYLPYILDIFKIFHFCDNNIIKGYIKKNYKWNFIVIVLVIPILKIFTKGLLEEKKNTGFSLARINLNNTDGAAKGSTLNQVNFTLTIKKATIEDKVYSNFSMFDIFIKSKEKYEIFLRDFFSNNFENLFEEHLKDLEEKAETDDQLKDKIKKMTLDDFILKKFEEYSLNMYYNEEINHTYLNPPSNTNVVFNNQTHIKIEEKPQVSKEQMNINGNQDSMDLI